MPHRIVENFDILGFALTPEDIAAIDAIDAVCGALNPEIVDTNATIDLEPHIDDGHESPNLRPVKHQG